jgi:hypothetical protein
MAGWPRCWHWADSAGGPGAQAGARTHVLHEVQHLQPFVGDRHLADRDVVATALQPRNDLVEGHPDDVDPQPHHLAKCLGQVRIDAEHVPGTVRRGVVQRRVADAHHRGEGAALAYLGGHQLGHRRYRRRGDHLGVRVRLGATAAAGEPGGEQGEAGGREDPYPH